MSDIDVLVVGAGVAGLAAAGTLEAAGREVCVVDGADAPGGVMRTDRIAGYTVERGPNTAQIKGPLRQLLDALGVSGGLRAASPVGRRRYLVRDGHLEPIPTGPLEFARTPLLSSAAKWRLLKEPFVGRVPAGGETVEEFVSRRLGPEVSENLVGAFLTGVYAGDERQLGAAPVFPSLVELEREHGSLLRGVVASALRRHLKGRKDAAGEGLPGSYSYEEGLGGLSSAMAGALRGPLRLATCAAALERESSGWRVECASADGDVQLRARQVVLATNAHDAARLLGETDPDCATRLARIEYAPIASVAFGADPHALARPPQGFGFLVPRSEGMKLLGCLFMSELFPGRAPTGRALLHCMLGGVLWPEAVDVPDDVLVAHATQSLEQLLGVKGALETLSVRRWRSAVAQPRRNHLSEIAALRADLSRHPGLALAGGYLQGVSVADAAASGLAAAAALD